MSDSVETAGTTTEATQTEGASSATNETETAQQQPKSESFTQQDVDRIVSERVNRERTKYSDYDQLKERASGVEALTSERDTLKSDLSGTQAENLRLRVALDKGLPGDLVDRLRGNSKEELEADADSLLALVKRPTGSGFDGGSRDDAPAPADMNAILRKATGRT